MAAPALLRVRPSLLGGSAGHVGRLRHGRDLKWPPKVSKSQLYKEVNAFCKQNWIEHVR